MTSAEYIQAERLRKTGRAPEYTLEYEDAKKKAERAEMWCGRNWLRMLIYFLPYTAAMILLPKLHMFWGYKFCLLVVCFGFCQVFYVRAFSRAVLKRLGAELQPRGN